MVLKSAKTLLGESWNDSFSSFRLNPELFLDKMKYTPDAFCLDVLKDLCSDDVEIQHKIHLLLLLQEYGSYLICDTNLLEQVIGSLSNFLHVLGVKTEYRLLKSHAIITIVSILLSWSLDDDISRLILKTKSLLLNILFNSSEDTVVVSSASKCLEEIESFYPGILESDVHAISKACDLEQSPSFQDHVLLLCTCIKNAVKKSQEINQDYLRKSTEFSTKEPFQIPTLVFRMLEYLPLMTEAATYRILRDLVYIVKSVPELSPVSTFKLHLQNLVVSSDVPSFHLAFYLLNEFGNELFSTQEKCFLLKQLLHLSIHPCLTSSHRLLYLDWIKGCIKSDMQFENDNFDLKMVLVSPFDGPLTQEKKSSLFALCIPQDTDENVSGEFLNESMSGLVKCSTLSESTKAAPSLFRTLYVYFILHQTKAMLDSIFRLITSVMKTSPHMTPYALSFLQSVKNKESQSKFQEKVLGHLVDHVLNAPEKQFHQNLEYYLNILDLASQEAASVCKPRSVLRLLQRLLSNSDFKIQNTWSIGNDILSICRSFLKHHNVQMFYYDLAEVLCLITQKVSDRDVKDRAKIYYCMLTTLSKLKVQTIFSSQSSEKDAYNALSSLVAGNEALQFASSVQYMPNSILLLVRTKKFGAKINEKDQADEKLVSGIDIFNTYQEFLEKKEPVVEIPLKLQHIGEDAFSELYGIVINTHSEPSAKDISVIEIPVLKATASSIKETDVNLKLMPLEPHPLKLYFKAEFTCNNGCSYSCQPPPIDLSLEDLFMPLPVPESLEQSAKSWRQQLFNHLWDKFKQQANPGSQALHICQSSFCLNIDKDEFPNLLDQHWKEFVVGSNEFPYDVAIFLPPKNHFLMKIFVVNEKPFVNMFVDSKSILPWITQCLQNLSKKS